MVHTFEIFSKTTSTKNKGNRRGEIGVMISSFPRYLNKGAVCTVLYNCERISKLMSSDVEQIAF